jgi:hypothetical protein
MDKAIEAILTAWEQWEQARPTDAQRVTQSAFAPF